VTLRLICGGSQKAGTQWLYDQLQGHPGVWMPPIKEVRYFHERSFARARREAERKLNDSLRRACRGEPLDLRETDFLRRYLWETQDRGGAITESYRRLFSASGSDFTADISPHYATLPYAFLKTLAIAFPSLRTVLIVREPASRLWSLVNMTVRHEWQAQDLAQDPDKLRAFLARPYVQALNRQSDTVMRWQAAFGPRFRAFVFDDLIADPATFRRKLFGFAKLDHAACALPPDFNKKSGREKVEMTPDVLRIMDETFADERARLADLLGGRAQRWLRLSAPGDRQPGS
jgi:hypothetical protein